MSYGTQKPMNISMLIDELSKHPGDMLVAYQCHSEQVLLEEGDCTLFQGCEPRPDGWVQNKRPDMPEKTYFLLPGN